MIREQAQRYIQLSGIVQLRQYCHSVPAEAQWRATATFLEAQVPAFLGSVSQWALSASGSISAERAAVLRRILSAEESTIKRVKPPARDIFIY